MVISLLYRIKVVKAIIIQNTNPLVVAPETLKVIKDFLGLTFTCVHEQFMTETAKYADILLPATSFVEHNDIYVSGMTSTSNTRS